MDAGTPTLEIQNLTESNPWNSRFLRGLAVCQHVWLRPRRLVVRGQLPCVGQLPLRIQLLLAQAIHQYFV